MFLFFEIVNCYAVYGNKWKINDWNIFGVNLPERIQHAEHFFFFELFETTRFWFRIQSRKNKNIDLQYTRERCYWPFPSISGWNVFSIMSPTPENLYYERLPLQTTDTNVRRETGNIYTDTFWVYVTNRIFFTPRMNDGQKHFSFWIRF